jgi:hypothetical protein
MVARPRHTKHIFKSVMLYGNSLVTVGLYKDGVSYCPCQNWGFVKAIWPSAKSLPDLLARSFGSSRPAVCRC